MNHARVLARRRSRRQAAAGFTLLEVLVAMMVMAIAVFPSLEIIREAEKNSFDAKFAELCASKARSLLSDITRTQKPGLSGSGDLSTLSKDQGGDDRNSFANIRFEWQCSAVDLSLDVSPAADLSDADKDAATKKRENQDKAQKDEAADAAIDERFRARYVRMVFTYNLNSGEERQIILETYVPPFPNEDANKDANGNDLVPPNNGSGGVTGGGKGGSSGKGGTSGKGGASSGKGGASSGKGGASSGKGGTPGKGGGTINSGGSGGKKGN
jgi:prepilin-type N-terminal cleavage/methylation domain-containing protein